MKRWLMIVIDLLLMSFASFMLIFAILTPDSREYVRIMSIGVCLLMIFMIAYITARDVKEIQDDDR